MSIPSVYGQAIPTHPVSVCVQKRGGPYLSHLLSIVFSTLDNIGKERGGERSAKKREVGETNCPSSPIPPCLFFAFSPRAALPACCCAALTNNGLHEAAQREREREISAGAGYSCFNNEFTCCFIFARASLLIHLCC